MPKIPLLIDTDPGVDDALALLMAFNDPGHEVVGLTVCAGNVGLEHTVANALQLCEAVGRDDVPVFAGADRPLLHPAGDAGYIHGRDGFGEAGLAPAARGPREEHAALAILRLSHEHAGRLLLVALGPLTNLALALRLDPTLPQRVARCVVMGGAVTGQGNVSDAAEFNAWFDPEAARIVFEAFPRVELADWEVVLRHPLGVADTEKWMRVPGPRAAFYAAISRFTLDWWRDRGHAQWCCADAVAMALALEPGSAAPLEERPMTVELAQGPARGATVVDWERSGPGQDNVAILMDYDQARFEALVRGALAGLHESPVGG